MSWAPDNAVFFRDLAEAVRFTPSPFPDLSSRTVTVQAIYRRAWSEIEGVAGRTATLIVNGADLPGGAAPVVNDKVYARAQLYRVAEVDDDGTGIYTLSLERQ